MLKTYSKRMLSIFISLTIILSALAITPITALAVDDPGTLDSAKLNFWADPENTITQDDITAFQGGDKTTMVGAVAVHKRSGSSSNYYLFLPTNADCTALKVWFTASSASVDGTPLTNGEATDAFSAANAGGVKSDHTLTLDGTDYSLHVMKSGEVGAVYIDTSSGTIANINNSSDKSVYESGTILVTRPDGTVDYDGALKKMKGRGNATWSAKGKKNPYNINLDKKASLLGMEKSKKWCLLANSDDSTLVKNEITYDFAEYIGVNSQVICKPVDLYVNQQYLGSYMLSEKVEVGKERVNVTDSYESLEEANAVTDPATGEVITDLEGRTEAEVKSYNDSNGTPAATGAQAYLQSNNIAHMVGARKYSPALTDPADVTGGYLYELEISNRWVDEPAGFCAYNRQGWVLKNCDFASKGMVDYSYDLLYALGSSVYNGGVVPSASTTTNCSGLSTVSIALYGPREITNPAPAAQYQGKKWSELLDADSAVKLYWTQELFKNLDSSTSSTYFYKDTDSKDSKLYAGPMWDMDKSFGTDSVLDSSRWGSSLTSSTGWYARNTRIYRWRANDGGTSYSNDNQAPRTFYGALANYCPDFWQMAKGSWYTLVEPAVQILLGNETDSTGTLKSIDEYVNTISKTGSMNKYRHNIDNDKAYDASSVGNTLKTWLSERRTWINGQFPTSDISTDSDFNVEAIPAQKYTGSAICPKLTVTCNGAVLKEGTDYSVEYSNNILPGDFAKATITGLGLYTGEKIVEFVISKGTLEGGSVTIKESAFPDEELTAEVKNADGSAISDGIVYQWYADDTAIQGQTANTYTTTQEDIGKTITVKAKGNGTVIDNYEITSNECAVRAPVVTNVIASWDYSYTDDSAALANADTSGETYYYTATGGEQKDKATLTGSFDAANSAEIKWSGSDIYANGAISDQAPILEADKVTPVAWGSYPYFETKLSTVGYDNLKISAKLGGSKKGAKNYKLQYSTDGSTYTDVTGAAYSVTTNKTLEEAFTKVALPEACNNKKNLYIRIVASDDVTIGGGAYVGTTSGAIAFNNISVTGEVVSVDTYTVTFINAAGTTVSSEEYPSGTPANEVAVPRVTASWYDDDFHYSYAWGTIADVTDNATYNETETKASHNGNYTEEIIKAPDCTNAGETKYTCTCGHSYTVYPEALGHTWGAPSYQWNQDNNVWKCTATRTCTRDANHVETETVTGVGAQSLAPTCTTKGKTTYTATFTNAAFAQQTKEVEDIDATDHAYGAPSYSWELVEGVWKCTATRVCANDANHIETETVNGVGAQSLAPTCTTKGKTTYTATFTNAAFAQQTKEVEDIAALEHDYVPVVTAPTCTEQGYTTYTCSRGDDSYINDYVPAKGHTGGAAVHENETATSYDEVVYCTSCHTELSRKTVSKAAPSVPEGTTPSETEANNAKENKSLITINASKIATFQSKKNKTLTLKFSTVKGATNYRVRYAKAGGKWTYAWTGGKGEYVIRNLKNKGLYQFQIAVYVYKNGVWQRSKYSNMNYRYFTKLSKVKAKAAKKSIKVNWAVDKKASGYDIAYATSKKGAKKVKTVKGAKKKAYTIKKLKKNKTYYVFARPYKMKGGKKYTGQWSTAKKIKVK